MATRPWPLIAAVTVSVLVHGALLAWGLDLWVPRARMLSRGELIEARLIPAPVAVAEPKPEPQAPTHATAVDAAPAAEAVPPLPHKQPSVAAAREAGAAAVSPPPRAAEPPPAAAAAAAASVQPNPDAPPSNPQDALAAGYRAAAQLDPAPRPLGDIDPEYPAAAGLQSGTVVLRLLIGATGTVNDVTVVRATPPGVFDASAIAAFGKALFAPGRYLGVPVKSQITIAVDYTPTNRGGAISGQNRFGGLR